MSGDRGYSFGEQYPIRYEKVGSRWEVFDARTDEVLDSVEHEWEAMDRAHALNGSPTPDLPGIDGTP